MQRHPAFAPAPVSRTAWALRWLVLLVVALDMLTSPLHAHAHDLGPSMLLDLAHLESHCDGDAARGVSHAEAPLHGMAAHSVATLKAAEQERLAGPSLSAIVAGVRALLPAEPAVGSYIEWPAAADHLPIPALCPLRPEGRAPPSLHA